jgi:hypothetical protein
LSALPRTLSALIHVINSRPGCNRSVGLYILSTNHGRLAPIFGSSEAIDGKFEDETDTLFTTAYSV